MARPPQLRTIVITGCSSGFGRLTALQLAKQGWQVFATVRKEADKESLLEEAQTLGEAAERLHVVLCDVTQAEQVRELGETVTAGTPRLDALLNNAGTAIAAPIELLSLDELRAQLEINTIAPIAVTQVLLPLLKATHGQIINVSSISGRIAAPIMGPYSASKFALEALSDALRVELAPFGVRVVLIEPTSSATSIWKTSSERSLGTLEAERNGPYARLLNALEKIAAELAAGKGGFAPQLFVDTVIKALESSRPRARYTVPANVAWLVRLRGLTSDRFWDRQIRKQMHW